MEGKQGIGFWYWQYFKCFLVFLVISLCCDAALLESQVEKTTIVKMDRSKGLLTVGGSGLTLLFDRLLKVPNNRLVKPDLFPC